MKYKIIIVILFHSTFSFQGCRSVNTHEDTVTDIKDVIDEINMKDSSVLILKEDKEIFSIDTFQTSLSDFISGKDKSYFDTIIKIDSDFWIEFSEDINKDFNKIKSRRLDKMTNWSSSSFISPDTDTSLVFYPFSGPDFLHSSVLYPNANEYILLALEDVGAVPIWKEIGSRETKRYLENTNNFLRDIYLRSYFITKHMKLDIKKEEKISGVMTSLYWFLSRTDHQIVKVEKVTIDKFGKLIEKQGNEGLDGVRFHFVKSGEETVKKLIYFSCDISDDGFEEDNPELLIYLNEMRNCNTFVKSASYLMHYRSFQKIRDVVLNKSISIFQDDTGMPFKFVNNDTWEVKCFGSYIKPIKDFEKHYNIIYQQDLSNKFKEGSIDLPFSLGYHWRDASDQNQMLITKVN